MKYWYQRPHLLLQPYLRTVLVFEGFAQPGEEQLPLFTNGMPALLCYMEKDATGNDTIIQLALFGKSITADLQRISAKTTIIAYFFKPFVLSCLFNVEAKKLAEDTMALSNWQAHKTNALNIQLISASSTAQKITSLDNLLLMQLGVQKKACDIIQQATDQILSNPSTEIIPALLSQLKLTERTFQRMFKKYVGITAGQYRRICQFQVSFDQVRSRDFNKLTDVAFDNGFADQSHFIRSFKEFTDKTPNDYLKSGLNKNK